MQRLRRRLTRLTEDVYKRQYMTFPKGTNTKWLTKTWLEDHVGGSGYNYVQHEATHDLSLIHISTPERYHKDVEYLQKIYDAV